MPVHLPRLPAPPRPMPLLAAAVLIGLWLYPEVQPEPAQCLAGIAALALLALLALLPGLRSGRAALLALGGIGLLLGLLLPARLPDPPRLRGEWGLAGEVASAGGREAILSLEAAAPHGAGWGPVRGRVLVRFPEQAPPMGSAVLVRGRAAPVDPTFLPGAPDPARRALRAGYRTRLTAREVSAPGDRPLSLDLAGAAHAGLLRALIDGDRSGIPPEVLARMQRTGTTHLLSISGLHIGLAALCCGGIGWLIGRPLALIWPWGGLRWLAAAAAVAGAGMYAEIAGWPVPAIRAVWVSAAAAGLGALHLRPDPAALLSLAMIGVLTGDPDAIHSVSFQLSFGAMIGMLLVPQRLTRWLPPDAPRWLRWPAEALAAGIGATAGTFPVTSYHFQDFPPLSTLANLWAVPLIGSFATPALLLSQLLPAPFGPLLLRLADGACGIGLWGLQFFDVAPWHPAVSFPMALLLGLAVWMRRRLLPALALTAYALWPAQPPEPDRLQIVFFSIGQGDAALVRWPDGRDWLIDGGPPGRDLLLELRRRGVRALDMILLSHPHPDHLGGLLPVAEALPVRRLRAPLPPDPAPDDAPDDAPDADDFARLAALIPDARYGIGDPEPGAEWLHPAPGFTGPRDPVNDQSLVVRLTWGARRFLFAGDIEAAGEAALLASGQDLRADLLKVPHHGSRTSSSATLLSAVQPGWALISCGFENRYRHPSPEVLGRYQGVTVLRTDRMGTVIVSSDGADLRVEAEGAPWPGDL